MLKHTNSDSTDVCTHCVKNSNLIKKYQELIRLYKKKQVKLSMDGSSRISNGRTTSNTLDFPSTEAPCLRLVDVLSQLMKTRCSPFFRLCLPKSTKKLVILNICNRLEKFAKLKAFIKLKLSRKPNPSEIINILSAKAKITLKNSFINLRTWGGISVIQQLINDTNTKPELLQKKIITQITKLTDDTKKTTTGSKWLQRRNVQLQFINKKLVLENETLRQCLQQSAKRQGKQNQKKKQSLEMLAEEISQKNQEIHHLKQTLKGYEQKYLSNKNVLEDDYIEMRKDVEHLENIRERLNNDLDKIKMQLQEVNKNLKNSIKKTEELEAQNREMKKMNFELDTKQAKLALASNQFIKLIKIMERKLKRLNVYQKQLEQAFISEKAVLKKQGDAVQQELKSEIILLFLANISTPEYKLHAEQLFDEDQKNMLLNHKQKWQKRHENLRMQLKVEHAPNLLENLEISEINMKGTNHLDSVFQALDSPRQNIREKGPTMKLLQLQIDKNKQVGKISELKQKLLHIRVIILKLLKSLQIQPGLKPETEGILRVIFDLFEYSEEERDSIFTKKKRLFGLI